MEKIEFSPSIQSFWQECYDRSERKIPFATYAWAKNYFETIGKNETPLILYDTERSIIAPFSRIHDRVTFSGGTEISDYMDLVGPDKQKSDAWKEILPILKDEGVLHLSLHNIPEYSPTLTFFRDYGATVNQEDTTPTIPLPKTYEEYLASLHRKNRHELQRKLRKFKRENPDAEIRISQQPQENIAILLQLMRLDERKKAFLTPDTEMFFLALPQLLPQECIFPTLFVQNEPVATVLIFKTDTAFLLYNSGFDLVRHPGASFYLKAETIRMAIEQGYKGYNFLQGHERYKYELGGKDVSVFSVDCPIGPQQIKA